MMTMTMMMKGRPMMVVRSSGDWTVIRFLQATHLPNLAVQRYFRSGARTLAHIT